MAYVYILLSKVDNKFYIGATTNLDNRLKEHNSGKVKSTKHRQPLELFWNKKYNTFSEARKQESYLKSIRNRQYLLKILNGPLAHPVEHRPFKAAVEGSSPSRLI